jgi:GTP cyclohydrolase II
MKYLAKIVSQGFIFENSDKETFSLQDFYQYIDTSIVEYLPIQIVGKPYYAWFCQEGKLRDLEPNAVLFDRGDVRDYLAGTIILTEYNNNRTDLLSEQSKKHLELFGKQYYVGTITNQFTNHQFFSQYPIFKYYIERR